jgi:ParB-like chromosome segregation protein Spo0J
MTSPTPSPLISAEELAAFAVHPLAELFPMISDDELRELAEDIRKNGMIEPIVLYEGKILDGRNRFNAAKLVSFPFRRANFRELLCHLDPRAYVISANIKRRHLTAEQKREVIAQLVKADPTKSNRQIAETTKADHKTVGAVREGLEARGEIPHTETTTDTTGRKQKTRKPRTEKQKVQDRYKAKQEELMDVLQEFPSWQHAEEYAERTKERLDETVHGMQDEAAA